MNRRNSDNITHFATIILLMGQLIFGIDLASLKIGLEINSSKTRLMIFVRANTISQEVTEIINCTVVPSYFYLGVLISNEKGCV